LLRLIKENTISKPFSFGRFPFYLNLLPLRLEREKVEVKRGGLSASIFSKEKRIYAAIPNAAFAKMMMVLLFQYRFQAIIT
jgi:hypothetical protein